MSRRLIPALSWLALAACASPRPQTPDVAGAQPALAPGAFIKVAESPCYFRCTQFEIVVRPDGSYRLDNIANTRKDGKSEGKFGPDVWAKAVAALAEAKFDTQTDVVDAAPGGPPCINDAPNIAISRHFQPGDDKVVRWYLGCPSKTLSELTQKLNEFFAYNTLTRPDN
jgi:hypothetical protein